jgi:hypothetical protein
VPGDGGCGYFGPKVSVLVNLLQFTFHAEPPRVGAGWTWPNEAHNAIPTAVVLYFSTLEEVLLKNLLAEAMTKCLVDVTQQDKVLRNAWSFRLRRLKLFPKFVGSSWSDALEQLPSMDAGTARSLNAFCDAVRERRDTFLHRGATWSIPPEMPRDCLRNTVGLLRLYVELHNRYIASKR